MAIQQIKLGGFVDEEVKKINENFSQCICSGNMPDVPTNTSDLTNDSNFVSDANYVHTDNNFTSAEKTKLQGIAEGAEPNVQSDWNATSGDAQILNKPDIPTVPQNVSAFTNDAEYQTATQVNAAVANKVDKITGKDLSTNDYTTDDKNKVARLGKIDFTSSQFGTLQADGYCYATIEADGKLPVKVMRQNGSDYEEVLIHTKVSGNNIVIVTCEPFSGYVITM